MNNIRFHIMRTFKQLFFVGYLLLTCTIVFGQGWETFIIADSTAYTQQSGHIAPTPDGGFLVVGFERVGFDNFDHAVVIKLDAEGIEQFRTVTALDESLGFALNSTDFISLSNGNYAYLGYNENPAFGPFLLNFDVNGNLLSSKQIGVPPNDGTQRMIESADGHLIILGTHGSNWAHIVKTTFDGDVVWAKTTFVKAQALDIIELANGNLITVGKVENAANSSYQDTLLVNAYNSSGNLIQNYQYNDFVYHAGSAIVATPDGGFMIGSNHQEYFNEDEIDPVWLIKIDANFDVEWSQSYLFANSIFEGHAFIKKMVSTNDGGFALMGEYIESVYANSFIAKTDSNGNLEWYYRYKQGNAFSTQFWDMEYLPAEDTYVLSGTIREGFSWDNVEMYVIKLDSEGLLFTNNFSGQAYIDGNENCLWGNNEDGVSNWKLHIEDEDGKENYFITDPYFDMDLDSGNFVANLLPLNELWETCPQDFEFIMDGQFNSLTMDFGATPVVDCPYMTVHTAGAFPRVCDEGNLYVWYCNNGTVPATDAYIEIEVDPLYQVTSATIPFTNVGNVYTFDLGTVDPLECGSFRVENYLSCDAILGETICLEAHIFPDTLCLPQSPAWSGASIAVDGFCANDSVSFTIQNVGTADMISALKYDIIVDDVILFQEPFDLDASESISPVYFADGSTIRLEAQQEPNHPGFSMPTVALEGCGGVFHEGFVELFPEDDADHFVDIFCRRIIGSYDPNDKLASPVGYGNEHFIEANQRLEYFVRFQNVGNAPAINVVIRDTISPHLNLATLVPSVSSHDYTFQFDGRTAIFTFDNIMLPDSTTNLEASQGVIKYTIEQNANNPIGTVINNNAGIYFDNNPPIITNQTWHTIGEDFIMIDLMVDADGDGYTADEDCDDNDPNISPDAIEVPNNDIDEDCDGIAQIIDLDGDGFNSDEDCDDNDAAVYPGAKEIAYNNTDDDCNELTLDDDLDEDGFGIADDCDDNDATIYPGAMEIANNEIDEDCDGEDLIISDVNNISIAQIDIFPNPTSGILTIQFPIHVEGSVSFKFYNGQRIFTQNLNRTNHIDLSELSAGVYLLEMKTGNNVWVERIVKSEF